MRAANNNASPRAAARFLWQQTKAGGRLRLFASMGCSVLSALSGVAFAAFLGLALGTCLDPAYGYDNLDPRLLPLILGAGLLRAIAGFVGERLGAYAASALRVALRYKLFQAVQERGPVALRDEETGSLITALMEQVEACDGYVARYLPQMAAALVVPPFIIIALATFAPTPALILLVALVLFPFLMAFTGILAGRASRRQLTALERLSGLFFDRLRQLTTLRIFGAEARTEAQLKQSSEDFRTRTMGVLRLAFLSAGVLDLLLLATLVSMVVYVVHMHLRFESALMLIVLVPEFFAPLRGLSAAYHDRAGALSAAVRLQELLAPQDLPPEGHRPAPSPLRQPSLEFRHVSYTYPGRSTPVLKDISLRIVGSEFVALKGRSGSGKSTLLHMLLGFINPQEGTLYLAGQDLLQIDPAERTAAFAWVGQRSHLFYGTLADNIRLGRPSARTDEIEAAAAAAQLTPLIKALPQGLQTIIGEGGFGLSGGQAQRVALARAFLRDAPVLLLDEPTAGLDRPTATALLQTIRDLATGRTVLMATHDPDALAMAERVIDMETLHV